MSLEHVVLFSFSPELAPEDEAEMYRQVRSWPETIRGLEELRLARPMFTERTRGYTHLLHIAVSDEGALEAYQRHPAHESFAAWVVEHGGTVLAFDYVLDSEAVILPLKP